MKKGILKHEKPHLKLGMIGAVSHGSASLTSAIRKTLARHTTHDPQDVYEARIGSDRDPAKHAVVIADSFEEAKKILEDEYGKGSVLSLQNREQANKPRQKLGPH